jgi:hypothetical protein
VSFLFVNYHKKSVYNVRFHYIIARANPKTAKIGARPRDVPRIAPPVLDVVVAAAAIVSAEALVLVVLALVVVVDATLVVEVVVLVEEVLLLAAVLELTARDPLPTAILVTGPVLESEFWYHAIPKASGTALTVQPLEIMIGYSFINTPTVLLFSSCSSMQRPLDLLPVSHPVMLASTPGTV